VFVGVVSRLDSLVSGVLVLARTSKAAARLNEQFREHTTEKIYWAVVESESVPASGECHDYLRKDESQHKVVVTSKSHSEAQFAHLRFRKLQTWAGKSLLGVELITGRKHQIRVQLASRNWPIVGDAKYLARTPFSSGIALHARSLRILHPTLKTPLQFTAPLPTSWRVFPVEEA
jgi:23S rRNA pseudouridine1911/1915/1917 synthase